ARCSGPMRPAPGMRATPRSAATSSIAARRPASVAPRRLGVASASGRTTGLTTTTGVSGWPWRTTRLKAAAAARIRPAECGAPDAAPPAPERQHRRPHAVGERPARSVPPRPPAEREPHPAVAELGLLFAYGRTGAPPAERPARAVAAIAEALGGGRVGDVDGL